MIPESPSTEFLALIDRRERVLSLMGRSGLPPAQPNNQPTLTLRTVVSGRTYGQ